MTGRWIQSGGVTPRPHDLACDGTLWIAKDFRDAVSEIAGAAQEKALAATLENAMLLVQELSTHWTKLSRGVPASLPRAHTPTALPLPRDPNAVPPDRDASA